MNNQGADRRRFYLFQPPAGPEITVRDELAHRIARVLRLPAGTPLDLFTGDGRAWVARIAAVEGSIVRLTVHGEQRHAPEPPTTLLAGLIRLNRFEWLIEKATELGVTAVQPVICAQSAVRATEIGAARLERWRRITIEAAEQCGRVTVPDLRPPTPLAAALDGWHGRRYVAAEPAHGGAPPLGTLLKDVDEVPVSLLIGPEGGLTPAEVAAASAAGAQSASLGPLVLRAETAALAALAVLADARSAGVGRQGLRVGDVEPAAPQSPAPDAR